MWDVKNIYIDLLLKSDQQLNPYEIKYPIIWKGTLKRKSIQIKQNSGVSSHEESYTFEDFPIELNDFKIKVIQSIDEALKKRLE